MTGMRKEIEAFSEYLQNTRHMARNTQLSYERDLRKMADYFEEKGILYVSQLNTAVLEEYLEALKGQGRKPSSISRSIASLKAFFQYLLQEKIIGEDPSMPLKAPKVEKKLPSVLKLEDVDRLLAQPGNRSDKEIRDKAMLELLYATGIRVSELLALRLTNLNLKNRFITVPSSSGKERVVPITDQAKKYVTRYLDTARPRMLEDRKSDILFVNCSGKPMSRQGFWKLVKHYASLAGIEADITPNSLRHTFAAHLVKSGANLRAVQEMMGHSDFSSTQRYTKLESVKKEYEKAHPRAEG